MRPTNKRVRSWRSPGRVWFRSEVRPLPRRILFDQGTPISLRRHLPAHSVSTTFELGWSQRVNGDPLAAAEKGFDVFVTTDQNLRYQQNLVGWRLAILILLFASWPKLQTRLPEVTAAIGASRPGDHVKSP